MSKTPDKRGVYKRIFHKHLSETPNGTLIASYIFRHLILSGLTINKTPINTSQE